MRRKIVHSFNCSGGSHDTVKTTVFPAPRSDRAFAAATRRCSKARTVQSGELAHPRHGTQPVRFLDVADTI